MLQFAARHVTCAFALAGSLATLGLAGEPAGGVAITFLANEGFLLEGGGKRVLIDALQGDGLPGYPALAGELRRKLEHGEPPFDRIDLVLASHHHGDHFDPKVVAAFLRRVPGTFFVSTTQAVGLLAAREEYAPLAKRVIGLAPEGAKRERLQVAGVALEVFGLPHADAENLGLVVGLAGRKILHVGDTDAGADVLARHRLAADTLDVVLVPYWYFLSADGRTAVNDSIAAKHVVAMHLPAANAEASWFAPATSLDDLLARLERDAPGVAVAHTALRTFAFPATGPHPGAVTGSPTTRP